MWKYGIATLIKWKREGGESKVKRLGVMRVAGKVDRESGIERGWI